MAEWTEDYISSAKEAIANRKRRIAGMHEEEEGLLKDIKDYEESIESVSKQE